MGSLTRESFLRVRIRAKQSAMDIAVIRCRSQTVRGSKKEATDRGDLFSAYFQRKSRSSPACGNSEEGQRSLGRRNRLIMQTTKNRKFPLGNALLYISLLSVALIASFTSSAILNNLFAICNSRLLPTNQIVNCDGRVRPQGRTLFLFCI